MFDDYSTAPGMRGASYFEQDAFDAICIEADRLGLQIAVHAIGDAAVNRTLNGYEAAQRANGRRDSRHRIEHIETLAPRRPAALRGLGRARLDAADARARRRLSAGAHPLDDRARADEDTGYAWQTIRRTGARLVFASDRPVAPLDPLFATRRR